MGVLRLLPAVFAAAFALGCGDQPTAPASPLAADGPSLVRTTQHSVGSDPFEGTITSACTGEEITFSGTLFTTLNIVSEPGNDDHVSLTHVLKATAIAQPSGTTYSLRDVQHESFQTPSLPAPIATTMRREVLVLVSKGAGRSEFFSLNVHLVFTPVVGDFRVVVESVSSVCR